MAVPEFPTDHPRPPRPVKDVKTAVLLAVFLGPLGLMYATVGRSLSRWQPAATITVQPPVCWGG